MQDELLTGLLSCVSDQPRNQGPSLQTGAAGKNGNPT